MIYVLQGESPRYRALWIAYIERCIEWRITMLERTQFEAPRLSGQEGRVAALAAEIRGTRRTVSDEEDEHWTDAAALWRRQSQEAREVVVASISAKVSAAPELVGLVDIPRRFVYLPSVAPVLTNAVADVARDCHVIWLVRTKLLGEDCEAARRAALWREAAYALAAVVNRFEHVAPETRRKHHEPAWEAVRINPLPDLPDLPLIPSLADDAP